MDYDRKTIEENGADHVKKCLRTLNTLDPNITSNDKGISWDGHILVYESIPFTKNKLRAKIPTQVKTRTYPKYRKRFSISMADLNNYKKEGSILYFWVQVVNGNYKIYYVSLFLIDLEKITKSNANKTEVSLEFLPFPEEKSAIQKVIEDYINVANKQKQVLPNIYDLDTFRKHYPHRAFSFELRLPKNPTARDIIKSIIEQKPYVYYQYDNGLSVPIGKIESEQFSLMTEDKIEIKVNNEVLYSKVKRENFNNKVIVRIGTTISLKLTENSFTVNYTIKNADITEAIKTLQFMIALISNEPIYFNNLRLFKSASLNTDIDVNALKKQLDMYLDIQILFNRLGIRQSLVLYSLSETELNNLMMLCQSELHNQEVPLRFKDSGFGFINIGNIHILCYYQQSERQGHFIIKSVFNKDLLLSFALSDYDGTRIPVGRYLLLLQYGVNGFRRIDNVNYDDLIESLNIDKIPPRVQEAYNKLLLDMLSFYDEVKYGKTLAACLWLSNYLWSNFENNINFINLCQVKYRNNTLTDSDKAEILKIKNATDNNMMKLACSILLRSLEESKIYYKNLQKTEQEAFKQLPISYLWTESEK